MPDAFIVGLVGGLIILAVLMAAFGPGFSVTAYGSASTPELVKNLSGATLVGEEEKEFSKVYNLDFAASNVKQTRTETAEKKVYSGLMFGQDALRMWMRAEDVQDARVSFHVRNTNGYGPLIIKVNGNAVFSQVLNIGDYDIELPKDTNVSEYNVEISAGSSGARMWAPAFYELESVKLEITSYVLSSAQMKFTMDDFQKYSRGELQLQLDDRFGKIIVELNGREIFRGYAESFELVKFSDRIGYENLLTIKSERDSRFTGTATLNIYYKDIVKTKIELPFNITSRQYSDGLRGYIKFYLADVSRDGGYTVKIYNNGEQLFSDYQKAEEGYESFLFGKGNVRVGENLLVIEAVDKAAFYTRNVEVRI
ncbi:MAG: hypothetical protein HZB67_01860 [Candidatus Aenigmarchaeota archaeon]|nr:hypothetical protein [Candidatus Aenigmarchaeota archaeon]